MYNSIIENATTCRTCNNTSERDKTASCRKFSQLEYFSPTSYFIFGTFGEIFLDASLYLNLYLGKFSTQYSHIILFPLTIRLHACVLQMCLSTYMYMQHIAIQVSTLLQRSIRLEAFAIHEACKVFAAGIERLELCRVSLMEPYVMLRYLI